MRALSAVASGSTPLRSLFLSSQLPPASRRPLTMRPSSSGYHSRAAAFASRQPRGGGRRHGGEGSDRVDALGRLL
jgi:hypothetical protein